MKMKECSKQNMALLYVPYVTAVNLNHNDNDNEKNLDFCLKIFPAEYKNKCS